MKSIDYLKLQAKNLHRDFRTQKPYTDSSLGENLFEYSPKYFDIDAIITDFNLNEQSFTLMNAQHVIANLAGFRKWNDLVKVNEAAQELGKLLFDNRHKIRNEEWEIYVRSIEVENGVILADEDKLGIFKTIFAEVDGHQADGYDYRLNIPIMYNDTISFTHSKKKKKVSKSQVTSLPIKGRMRSEFIRVANEKFDEILQRIEYEEPVVLHQIWNADEYIDNILFKEDMLPINKDYALSLIDAFLIHHVLELIEKE